MNTFSEKGDPSSLAFLKEKADSLFRFVMLYHDFAIEKKDYGTGKYVNMVEVHMLLHIATAPGITISELAEKAKRTKSAVSQTVRKLETMGYVYRDVLPEDKRVVRLYPTEVGLELNAAHIRYDAVEVDHTFTEILKTCSREELDAFYRVIDAYITIFDED